MKTNEEIFNPLTVPDLANMEPGTVFLKVVTTNDPEGVFMTRNRQGDKLRWVAKRGDGPDWAIYIDFENHSFTEIEEYGDKVRSWEHIQRLVPCTAEALAAYRQ